ncbi:hypothetical protein EC973_009017 [Apophysomyces ossiformis]|uniref:Major facilitator superfamily (MFS) profile domain-containing protein n=1 Tax=Apophysomyces ossiformis TaxID=679940 RepID=A0A8H7BW97_9FUNG|nr:hypothetical protein EC973_009017 [Apophysomyces ossiformis]
MDSRELYMPNYMVYCVAISCLTSFCVGWTIGSPNIAGDITHSCPTGNAHTANPSFPDCLPMTTALWGFAVASFCIGGLIGGICGGTVQMALGRKKTIIINAWGWIIGAILIGLSVHTSMFIVGRIFCGLSCGLGSLATPTYIGEVSTIKARGTMGTCHQFFIVIGILLSSVIGLPTSVVPLWRINFAIVAIPAIVQVIMMLTCVESPRWLISMNRIDEASEALKKLRGPNVDILLELFDIIEGQMGSAAAREKLSLPQEQIHKEDYENPVTERREPLNVFQIFKDPVIRRIAFLVLFLHTFQQLSGMNAVMYFSTTVFKSAIDFQTAKYMTIATMGVNFLFTLVSVVMIDRMGRRALFLIATAGTCLFSVTLVLGSSFNVPVLMVISVFLYVASFAIGIGPIPWMITSELTPIYASSSVGAAATAMNWAMNFLVGQVFPVVFAAIGGYSFLIFAGTSLFAFFVIFLTLPETKGRPIEDIVKSFERRSS